MNKNEKMIYEKMLAENARLKAENEALKAGKKPEAEPDFKISFINYLNDLAEKKDSGQLNIIAKIIAAKGSPADLFNYSAFALNILKLISAENFKILKAAYSRAVSQAEAWPAFIALKPKKSAKNIAAKNEPGRQEAAA